jgi:UDP-N-acetylmuramoyl-tripeptide--D-alanyl-D-alanine ligase
VRNKRVLRVRSPKVLRKAIKGCKITRLTRRARTWRAKIYRRLVLRTVRVVGITGSCGKTSTKELTAAILSTGLRGRKSPGIRNLPDSIASAILEAGPRDEFYVAEMAVASKGRVAFGPFLDMLRPDVGVVTNIGTDHLSAFGSVEAIAEAKGKLIEALPARGAAILNRDDPLVAAMASKCRGRVVTFGMSAEATLRAENVRSLWPERLTFTLAHGSDRLPVETQMCGTFWVYPVLAAIGVGLEFGIPLADAISAVRRVPPYDERMEPVVRPDGVTFIRDDHKAPIDSIGLALDFMRDARAARKIVIIGSISDYRGNSSRVFASVARRALEVADCVAFVGPRASKCLKAQKEGEKGRLRAFLSAEAAAEHFNGVFKPDDLVLLKGGWRDGLGKIVEGTACGTAERTSESMASSSPSVFAVVGIGNPEARHADDPHNVGHRVVDLFAQSLGLCWKNSGEALVASQSDGRGTLHLVKPMSKVNNSGKDVLRLSEVLGFRQEEFIVVLDDINLPVGKVRQRTRGSDGGHLGVRSILAAFGSDEVRRLRIGVGRPKQGGSVAKHVLSPVAREDRDSLDAGCFRAVEVLNDQLREMLGPTGGIEPPTSPM